MGQEAEVTAGEVVWRASIKHIKNEELVALAADARSRLGTDLPCRTYNKLGHVVDMLGTR